MVTSIESVDANVIGVVAVTFWFPLVFTVFRINAPATLEITPHQYNAPALAPEPTRTVTAPDGK